MSQEADKKHKRSKKESEKVEAAEVPETTHDNGSAKERKHKSKDKKEHKDKSKRKEKDDTTESAADESSKDDKRNKDKDAKKDTDTKAAKADAKESKPEDDKLKKKQKLDEQKKKQQEEAARMKQAEEEKKKAKEEEKKKKQEEKQKRAEEEKKQEQEKKTKEDAATKKKLKDIASLSTKRKKYISHLNPTAPDEIPADHVVDTELLKKLEEFRQAKNEIADAGVDALAANAFNTINALYELLEDVLVQEPPFVPESRASRKRATKAKPTKAEDQIVIVSKNKSLQEITDKYGGIDGSGAHIVDCTHLGAQPYIKFSPLYPHAKIPVPFTSESDDVSIKYSKSVLGIWEALKVFEKKEGVSYENRPFDVDLAKMAVADMKGVKRATNMFGTLKGWRKGPKGTEVLSERDARYLIFLPAYKYVLDNRMQKEIEDLKAVLAEGKRLVLQDSTLHSDLDDLSKKDFSVASLVKAYLLNQWPVYDPNRPIKLKQEHDDGMDTSTISEGEVSSPVKKPRSKKRKSSPPPTPSATPLKSAPPTAPATPATAPPTATPKSSSKKAKKGTA